MCIWQGSRTCFGKALDRLPKGGGANGDSESEGDADLLLLRAPSPLPKGLTDLLGSRSFVLILDDLIPFSV